MYKALVAIVLVLGAILLVNGVVMLVVPENWYWTVPGVPDRGPFNQHFVRDIGFIYVLAGSCFLFGLRDLQHRIVWWFIPTVWLTCHSMFHIWEVAVGICGPEALLVDFMGVTLPSLLGLALCVYAYRQSADKKTAQVQPGDLYHRPKNNR